MKELKEKIKVLEKTIEKIEKRNKKVEVDKSWETSSFRKVSIAVITYLIILIIMYLFGFKNIFINALIPTFGYLLSTLSIGILKKIYIKKCINR
jgi:preprotein translocase subunit SecF